MFLWKAFMTDDDKALVERLLPCPFCKSTDIKSFSSVKDTGDSMQIVQCWGCGAEMSRWLPYALDDEREQLLLEVVAKWNNRVTTRYDVADDLLDRLQATWCGRSGMEEKHLINPDGPEAADRIEAQAAEIERLKCEVKKQRSLRDQASFNAGLEQAAVIAKEWGDDAALTIDDVDGLSAINLAAVKGNVAAAFAISTAIRAALGETK